jgi:phage protein U
MWSPGWGWTLAGLESIAWIGTWVAGGSARLELLVAVAYRGNKHPKLHGQAAVSGFVVAGSPFSPVDVCRIALL